MRTIVDPKLLKAARVRLGLTSKDAATAIGIPLYLETAHRIALAIGADPHFIDPRLNPGPPDRVLTMHITADMNLVGETPEDDTLVMQLLPYRPGDVVTKRGPSPARSNLEALVTRAAISKVRLIIRTDLPPHDTGA